MSNVTCRVHISLKKLKKTKVIVCPKKYGLNWLKWRSTSVHTAIKHLFTLVISKLTCIFTLVLLLTENTSALIAVKHFHTAANSSITYECTHAKNLSVVRFVRSRLPGKVISNITCGVNMARNSSVAISVESRLFWKVASNFIQDFT